MGLSLWYLGAPRLGSTKGAFVLGAARVKRLAPQSEPAQARIAQLGPRNEQGVGGERRIGVGWARAGVRPQLPPQRRQHSLAAVLVHQPDQPAQPLRAAQVFEMLLAVLFAVRREDTGGHAVLRDENEKVVQVPRRLQLLVGKMQIDLDQSALMSAPQDRTAVRSTLDKRAGAEAYHDLQSGALRPLCPPPSKGDQPCRQKIVGRHSEAHVVRRDDCCVALGPCLVVCDLRHG